MQRATQATLTWFPQSAFQNITLQLVRAVEVASADGADRARAIAPLGKGENQATGANPRAFSVRLRTTHEFKRTEKARRLTRRQAVESAKRLSRLKDLRLMTRAELVQSIRSSDVEFFRFHDRVHRNETTGVTYRTPGEQPDELKILPARGPGGEAVKGIRTSHRPGRLRKGIHPLEPKAQGAGVVGGYASEAPYSNVVEKGFHHKGGTVVEGKHFMKRSAEAMRAAWNRGSYFEE